MGERNKESMVGVVSVSLRASFTASIPLIYVERGQPRTVF